MALQKTFFSYSRDDSEFVLKLAKDLRAAGADIWLDQLDIPAGKRWDAEIEQALEKSQGQLVILSPSSVASNNVMDEVSYSLEKGKQVIPILFKECQIPFRLKRLQYIDFTGNYEAGFNQLMRALNLATPPTAETLSDDSVEKPTVKSDEEESKVAEENQQKLQREAEVKRAEKIKKAESIKERKLDEEKSKQPTSETFFRETPALNKGPNKWAVGVSVLVVVIAAIIFITTNDNTAAAEEEAWRIADSTYTIFAYDEYLQKYPEGKHIADARDRIAEIEEMLENHTTLADPEDMVMCEGVENLNPVGITNQFYPGRVYVWASVIAPRNEDVIFEWIDEDNNLLASTTINVGEDINGYRIYAYHSINEPGNYEVHLYNSKDYLIGSQSFTVE